MVCPKGNNCSAVERTEWTIYARETVSQPPPVTGAVTPTKILTAVKEQALQDVFKPASAIVEEVSMQNK